MANIGSQFESIGGQNAIATYSQRPALFSKERTYVLTERELLVRYNSGEEEVIPYEDITEVRVYTVFRTMRSRYQARRHPYRPYRRYFRRYYLYIKLQNGKSLKISSIDYQNIFIYKKREEEYYHFLMAFHRVLPKVNSNVRYIARPPQPGIFSWIVIILLLAYVLYSWRGSFKFELSSKNIGIIASVVMSLAFLLYVRKRLPREYTPDNIPPFVLPRIE